MRNEGLNKEAKNYEKEKRPKIDKKKQKKISHISQNQTGRLLAG
jgi:hypothetical protein